MHVKDKVCVVTGGASGIGEAVARAYAEAGARGVVVADLKTSRDRLASVAGDIDGLAVTADVGLEEDIKALIAAAEDKYGPVDVFFSNAGLSRKGQETASDADWDVSWRVHVMSHVFAARALVLETAAGKDAGKDVVMESAAAKYYASEMVGRVADRAVQIFGGAGYIADYGIERLYRDVRLFRIYEGTSQIQQLIIARETIKRGG